MIGHLLVSARKNVDH